MGRRPPATPLVGGLKTLVNDALERWADECAAQQMGDRTLVAHAVGTAALATAPKPGPAFPHALDIARHGVVGRVHALLHPPRTTWLPALIAISCIPCLAIIADLDAARDLAAAVATLH